MNPAYCPNCGTKRDASFFEPDGRCVAVHCLPCGIYHPCCPECGITGIRSTENQLELYCPSCEVTFPKPKIEDDEWGITSKEMQFLLNVGEHLSLHISKLRSLHQYEEKLGKEVSEERYLKDELKFFLVIPELLEWRQQVLEKKAKLPDVDYIVDKFLTDNSRYRLTSRQARIKTAKVLRKLLAEVLKLYRKKSPPPLVRQLIQAVVESELKKGSDYKKVLEKLYEKDQVDLMDMDSMFKGYKLKYGVSDWRDIQTNEPAKRAFQTWLSRCKKRLELAGELELDL